MVTSKSVRPVVKKVGCGKYNRLYCVNYQVNHYESVINDTAVQIHGRGKGFRSHTDSL
jgi:hypothetical protein